jgi:uncharacterized small protein (DUF1192 family)
VQHAIGEPLDTLSLEELKSRIAALLTEIKRIEGEMDRKRASRDVASTFFRGGST